MLFKFTPFYRSAGQNISPLIKVYLDAEILSLYSHNYSKKLHY